MRILSCGGLFFFCVYMSPETCNAGVYSPNRSTGLWQANEDPKIVTTFVADNEFGEKILRRKPRCYDNSENYNDPETAVTVKSLAVKLPAWAGTLYHHRILHPYHDWSNTGIADDLWNR